MNTSLNESDYHSQYMDHGRVVVPTSVGNVKEPSAGNSQRWTQEPMTGPSRN